jgi:hypothetical protein
MRTYEYGKNEVKLITGGSGVRRVVNTESTWFILLHMKFIL